MTTTVTTGSRTWTVDTAHSNIGFITRHMMIAKVRGKFTRVKGELQIPEGTVIPQSIVAEIGAASVDTREDQRNGHLRSADFFDAENYPQLIFKSTSIRNVSDAAFDVTGDLTIRRTTKSVTFPVEVEGQGADPWGGRRIGYSAKLGVDRRDFGLTFNRHWKPAACSLATRSTSSSTLRPSPRQASGSCRR
ncbi:MAG: YceI family protein [Vulcanimicrobiaceae bacterium]